MGTYKVRIRLDCERYDFILRRRVLDVLDVFEEHEFENQKECIDYIDTTLKSSEFVSKYYAYKLKIEILENMEVKCFVVIHLGWDNETTFIFSSDEELLPLKKEYYHERKEASL